jgi:hypothetical protein
MSLQAVGDIIGGSSVACLVGIIVSGVLGEVIGIAPVVAAQGAGYVLWPDQQFQTGAYQLEANIESYHSTRCVQYCAIREYARTGSQINVC